MIEDPALIKPFSEGVVKVGICNIRKHHKRKLTLSSNFFIFHFRLYNFRLYTFTPFALTPVDLYAFRFNDF